MFSIIIPTMQKNVNVLNMLLKELDDDTLIKEIIIIDNSLKGVEFVSKKLKVIVPNKNLYVNPSWNLGVQYAKYDYVGILNDDLIFPKNFFNQVFNFIINTPKAGFIGLDTIEKTSPEDFVNYPQNTELVFKPIEERCVCWGSAIFFKKENYIKIPENIKIWYGDDFLFEENIKNKKINYAISNSNIKHLHSLTSDLKEFDIIKKNDQCLYKAYHKQEIPLLQKIFSVTNEYKNYIKYKKIILLGWEISFKVKNFK